MVNKIKISITLNDTLMRLIDLIRGDIPRSKFIENYLKGSIGIFEAIWIYGDELDKITKKEFLYSHISQPLGKPLHRYEGFIDINKESLDFYDVTLEKLFSVPKQDIKSFKVCYDKRFRRLLHSRGANPPMHFSFDKRTIYLFTRPIGGIVFKGNNDAISRALI